MCVLTDMRKGGDFLHNNVKDLCIVRLNDMEYKGSLRFEKTNKKKEFMKPRLYYVFVWIKRIDVSQTYG